MNLDTDSSNSIINIKPESSLNTSNVSDRKEVCHYYLKKHRIMDLFDNLTASLLYERPDNPKEYMIEYIKSLHTSRLAQIDYPSLFDESNIKSLFDIMDPAGKGFINHSQYKSGMENLGVSAYERNPNGCEEDKIRLDTFITEAKTGLLEATATFSR